jgi:hypothetical protein
LRVSAGLAPASPLSLPIRGKRHLKSSIRLRIILAQDVLPSIKIEKKSSRLAGNFFGDHFPGFFFIPVDFLAGAWLLCRALLLEPFAFWGVDAVFDLLAA